METDPKTTHWLDRPLSEYLPKFKIENLLVAIIILLAVLSRFVDVDKRTMAHDEVNHVVPAYDYYAKGTYAYDPVTHGPFQFHMLALSYFLFGDSDFSARIPAAAASVITVVVVLFAFRRYLGRSGALIAGFLFVISPYMMFYGRYTRNEGFAQLWGVLLLYAVLLYLEKGERKTLYLLTIVAALIFVDKATSFIYVALLLIFLLVVFGRGVWRSVWRKDHLRRLFTLLMILMIIMVIAALIFAIWNSTLKPTTAPDILTSPDVSPQDLPKTPPTAAYVGELVCLAITLVSGLAAVIIVVLGLGWKEIRKQRSFDIMILLGTFVLPQLGAIPTTLVGWNPLDYETGIWRTALFVVPLIILSVAIGLWWRWKLWLPLAGIFWAIFTVFFTSFFTNVRGFQVGLVGALGYWMSQQGVTRGSQPYFYYLFVQIPVYEYLAALGTILALYFGTRYRRFIIWAGIAPAHQPAESEAPRFEEVLPGRLHKPDYSPDVLATKADDGNSQVDTSVHKVPVLALLLYWTVMSLAAFSVAGEKMPWLTVNIALPMLLASGWGLGFLVDSTPWKRLRENKSWAAFLVMPIFLTSLAACIGSWLGPITPFRGKTLEELSMTNQFLLSTIVVIISGVVVYRLLSKWRFVFILRLATAAFFILIAVLTARTAYRAAFINYDYATEFLVYAHAAPGPKEVFQEIEELSFRLTGGRDLVVAYDNDMLYPFWWYLREYPNKNFFAGAPTRQLLDAQVVVCGDETHADVDRILSEDFVVFKYKRLWWPMQDYTDMFKSRDGKQSFSLERVWETISQPERRQALWDIWFNRDYKLYAQINERKNLTLENWEPSANFWLYIRKDVVAQVWQYSTQPEVAVVTDPYKAQLLSLTPVKSVGAIGAEPGQFVQPRMIAFAADGSFYVADTGNHRIQHIAKDGSVLQIWGGFADVTSGTAAPGGTFNQPWGVAVGPDGSVYVTDTWNHRVQKFTADGVFIKMWGYWGAAEDPFALYGPRGIVVDKEGKVYITDTGNKRVVIFNSEGEFIAEFGKGGFDPGEFDEPVGIAVDGEGLVYVADTWNKRIQVMLPDASGTNYQPLYNFDISGWKGQSLENKPFITLDDKGNLLVADPEKGRVLVFDTQGNYRWGWTVYSPVNEALGVLSGIAVDPEGYVWVSDSADAIMLKYDISNLPTQGGQPDVSLPSPTSQSEGGQ